MIPTETEILIFLQIIFEMLPISSSVQVKVIHDLLIKYGVFQASLPANLPREDIVKLFNLASDGVVLFFFKHKIPKINKLFFKKTMSIFMLAGLANFITMIIYLTGKNFSSIYNLDKYASKNIILITLSASFLINISLIFRDRFFGKKDESISWSKSILIGACQGLSLFKGVSRLGITYVAARWLSLNQQLAIIFSFLLHFQISALFFAKTILLEKGYKTLPFQFTQGGVLLILIGILISYFLFGVTYKLIKQQKFYFFAPFFLITGFILLKFL